MKMKNCLLILLLLPLAVFADNPGDKGDVTTEISKHYAALPNLYKLDAMSKETLSDKITRQYIMGSHSMIVKWELKKGAFIPMHFHPNEQITWITQGAVSVLSQGKKFIVKAGEILVIPPYVPHEFYALEDTIDIDFFSSVRDDWLNNTATYIQKTPAKE